MEETRYGRHRSFPAEGWMLDDSTKPQPSGDDKQSLSALNQPRRPSTDLNTDSKKWQSCCCFHVRKVTIVVCVLRLLLGIVGLCALFYFLKETDDSYYGRLKFYSLKKSYGSNYGIKPHGMSSLEWLQTVKSSSVTSRNPSIVINVNSNLHQIYEKIHRSELLDNFKSIYSCIYWGIALSLIIIVLTSMTLYGAVKIKPRCMIPSITIEATFLVIECGIFVIGVIVLSCYQQWPYLIIPMVVGLKIPFDCYFINIFWRCYQFCLLQREVISTGGALSTEMRA